MEQTKPSQSLPDNAYRELKPGEEYVPMMPADAKPKEVTPYSVTMGLLMAVLFSAAAAYLGLRIGQVFEAAIPIAIIAVGVGNMLGKKHAGTERHHTVDRRLVGHHRRRSDLHPAGALHPRFGNRILQSIPFIGIGRYSGYRTAHPLPQIFRQGDARQVPFPEATATTEVLVSGEKGGNQAKLLAVAGLVGGLYDFAASTFGLWTEEISTRMTAGHPLRR